MLAKHLGDQAFDEAHTGLATSPISIGEIASLIHELGNDTVESGALISKTLLSSCQCSEIFRGFWDCLAVQAHDNTPYGLVAMGNIEVDLVGDLGTFCGRRCLSKEQKRGG